MASQPEPVPSSRLRPLFWWGLAAALTAVDLAVKALVEARLAGGQVIDFGVLNIRLGYNTGVAFSIGAALPGWVIIAFTAIITTAVAGYLWHQAAAGARLQLTGLAFVLGGAAGNLIDRLNGTGVTDYLHTGWFPTFNLADVFITLGAATIALSALSAPREPGDKGNDSQQGSGTSQPERGL